LKKCKHLTPDKRKKLLEVGKRWHRRMMHISAPYLTRLPHVAIGVDELLYNDTIANCEVCALAKMKRKSFSKTRMPATRTGETVHANLIGEITPVTRYKLK